MKAWIQLFASIGLVGCFLPLVSGISWWEMRHMASGWVVYAVVAAFAIPLIMRDARILTAAFAFIVYEIPIYRFIFHCSIGGVMMGIGAFAGLVLSVAYFGKRSLGI